MSTRLTRLSLAEALRQPTAAAVVEELGGGGVPYVHPETHPASMIEQDAAHRFVTDEEKAALSSTGGLTQAQILTRQL